MAATLIGDIGGTHARFAWADGAGGYGGAVRLAVAEFASLEQALAAVLRERRAERALLALAGPVRGGVCRLTNNPWGRIEAAAISARCGIPEVELLNDLAAQAFLLPRLQPGQWIPLGGGAGDPAAPRLLVHLGTGFGAALWVPGAGPVATEAGHASLAGGNAEEDRVIAALRDRYGHASAERALSGPGLRELHALLGEQAGEEMFLSLLAGHLGSLALATGAAGGVWLAGEILKARRDRLAAPLFRARFLAKGRFAEWLAELPVGLVTLAEPGLTGLALRAALHGSGGAATATAPDSP
ncbi:MAG: glucokinase [Rhodovarius sp.]|nr:glucokinase [Rhodovarius sp.]